MKMWLVTRKALNLLALPLWVGGMGVIAFWNWRQWQRDKALAAKWRKSMQTVPVLSTTPLVSVLVAAWDEAEHIQAHIESFLKLRYPNKQLVICAGGHDSTYRIASAYRDFPECIIIEQRPGEGKQRALRRSLTYATGDIIYLTDADCLLNDDAFERVIAPLVNDGAAAATGLSLPLSRNQDNPLVIYTGAVDLHMAFAFPDPANGLLGRNCAISRKVLEETGGFNREAYSGTDYTLARQLLTNGHGIRGVNSSIVETHYPDTVRQYFWQRVRWLRNMVVIGLKTHDRLEVRRALMGAAVSLGFLTALLSIFVLGVFGVVCWLLLLVHALVMRWRRILFVPDLGWRARLKTLATAMLLFVVDLFVRIIGVIEGLVPGRHTTWKQPERTELPGQETENSYQDTTVHDLTDEVVP